MSDRAQEFFVPFIEASNHETVYAELAQSSGLAVPDRSRRVASISFTHNGEVWTATVGETLKGVRRRSIGRASTKREIEEKLTDHATVVAIFESHPYVVWTNLGSSTCRRSKWANPFYAGQVGRTTYFE